MARRIKRPVTIRIILPLLLVASGAVNWLVPRPAWRMYSAPVEVTAAGTRTEGAATTLDVRITNRDQPEVHVEVIESPVRPDQSVRSGEVSLNSAFTSGPDIAGSPAHDAPR